MAGLWFFAGIGIGILHGVTLWWTVAVLQPDKVRRALILAWGGAWLRCLAVAGLLMAAVNDALHSCLWAFTGFFLARLAWVGMIELRMANTKRTVSK